MFFCFTFFKDCGKFELKSFLTILFVNNAVDFSTSNRAMIIKRKQQKSLLRSALICINFERPLPRKSSILVSSDVIGSLNLNRIFFCQLFFFVCLFFAVVFLCHLVYIQLTRPSLYIEKGDIYRDREFINFCSF